MRSKYKTNAGKHTMLSGVILGVILSTVLSAACAGILAALAIGERISESGINIAVIMTQCFAAVLGVILASKLVEEKKALTSIVACVSYLAVLIGTTLLFFDGKFNRLWPGVCAVIVGGVIAALLCARQGGKSRGAAAWRKRRPR